MRTQASIALIVISLTVPFLSGCAPAQIRPNSSTRSSLEGKGFSVNVEEISFFSASPAMLPAVIIGGPIGGHIAGNAKGQSVQKQFGLVDPGRALSEMVRLDLSNTYGIKEGNDFLLKISSRTWVVNICVFDNCRTSRQFWYVANVQLSRTSDSAVIANKDCVYRGFVDPDTYWNDGAIAIKDQGRSAADFCRKDIMDWISGGV